MSTSHIPDEVSNGGEHGGWSSLVYRIAPWAPALAPLSWLSLLGDERDMERAVLHIGASTQDEQQRIAKHAYLPVQAIPQGMAKPDVVAEVFDGPVLLTTLHFCTAWTMGTLGQRRQDLAEGQTFERVSFPSLQHAVLYNRQERLEVCLSCHRLHRHTCGLAGTRSLEHALILTGLALCVCEGYVYLVSGEPTGPLASTRFRGRVYWYAITGLQGLQSCYGFSPTHLKLEQCNRYLAERAVPLRNGWMAVEEPIMCAPFLHHWMRGKERQKQNTHELSNE